MLISRIFPEQRAHTIAVGLLEALLAVMKCRWTCDNRCEAAEEFRTKDIANRRDMTGIDKSVSSSLALVTEGAIPFLMDELVVIRVPRLAFATFMAFSISWSIVEGSRSSDGAIPSPCS